MANKKNIDAFQEAMLSNTKMIGKEQGGKSEPKKEISRTKKPVKSALLNGISPELNKKILAFSAKYDIPADTIIDKSVDLFLSLEDYWFESGNN